MLNAIWAELFSVCAQLYFDFCKVEGATITLFLALATVAI